MAAVEPIAGEGIEARVSAYDWNAVEAELADRGYARLPRLLEDRECDELGRLFERDECFRSTIDMARHGYGEGRYRYFDHPLPPLITALREHLYPPLAVVANRWQEQLALESRYPPLLEAFVARCHAEGQRRPTPLLLHYRSGGYNRMHQDRYGELAFPLQVTCLLSAPTDSEPPAPGFHGGAFLVSEHRARMQTRTTAVELERGEGIVFANATRPVKGSRGFVRAEMRHGVSRVESGGRMALGIIFHDAE